MGFDFSGHVFRGPRAATTNASSTEETTNGVVRDVRAVPASYDLDAPIAPDLVEVFADQYRTAVLEASGTTPIEYLIWAQNSSNLALVEDSSWWLEEGTGRIPAGQLTVTDLTPEGLDPGTFEDGSSQVVVVDDGNREIGRITHLVVARGDVDDYDDGGWRDPEDPDTPPRRLGDSPYLVLDILTANQDPSKNLVTLTSSQLTTLGGGLSQSRGDQIITVRYTLAPAKFWWTRNDRYETRFGFNSETQRWEPYKGSAPKDLGRLTFDEAYILSPRVSRLPAESFLPGDASTPDSYAMIRLGESPDALSTPVAAIQIRTDREVEDGFDFAEYGDLDGVVGQGNGILLFNPTFVEQHAGKTVWYVFQDFERNATGVIGTVGSNDLFLAPVPGPSDFPFIRLGSRRHLSVTLVDTDADLAAADDPGVSGVLVSLATGKLRLSQAVLDLADPTSATFDKYYLGEQVVYDGVALNRMPQPTKAPVRLVGTGGAAAVAESSNTLYVPDAVALPEEFSSDDPSRGLGKSGILDLPDGTGGIPNLSTLPGIRPGGDDFGDPNPGLVRQVEDGVGDTFVFSRKGVVQNLTVVGPTSDLPSERRVPGDTVYIARELEFGSGSQVALGPVSRSLFDGDPVYFLQASLTPAVYTVEPKLVSRNRLIFRFDGTEALYFAVDGTAYASGDEWLSSSLPVQDFYTAEEVAESIQDHIDGLVGPGTVYEQNGRVVIQGVTSVEIGFGSGGEKDLSGATALGFIPGWRAVDGVVNWLPDSGVSLGLHRSPLNLDRSRSVADFRAEGRVEDFVLQESIQAQPFVFLDQPPIQDVSGFDENIFFTLTTVVAQGESVQIVQKPLDHFGDILYRFGEGRFAWLEGNTISRIVPQAQNVLSLEQAGVVPESLLGASGIGGGLYVAETGGRYQFLEQDTDYLLPEEGQSGFAVLTEKFGGRELFGSNGSFTSGSNLFNDLTTDSQGAYVYDFVSSGVLPGYRLKLTSGPVGSYIVQEVLSATQLRVSPSFLEGSDLPASWEIYRGYEEDVFDPGVVADALYQEFQHLEEEPFKVRVLTSLGTTPASSSAQTASRLRADLGNALASGRSLNVRFGLEAPTAANTATLLELGTTTLGAMANDVLQVPDTDHFSVGSFSIQVGTELFTHSGGGLTGVTSLSADPGAGIEYLTAEWESPDGTLSEGTLRFGSTVLDDLESSTVFYVEEFRAPSAVPDLVVEYNKHTGYLNISQDQIDSFGALGTTVYLVEQMVTENRQDVGLSPMAGAFGFQSPIQEMQVVEVSYFAADLEGRKTGDEIIEFLPVFIRDEVAQRVDQSKYLFNTAGRTVDQSFDPVVYVGPVQQNFGSSDFVVDYPSDLNGAGRITFISKTLASHLEVTVSYAVFEANGGERAYESSTKPVYRPPFFITENQDRFGLRGSRVSDFQVGQMLRIGSECFYISSLTYYPVRYEQQGNQLVQKGDVTSVGIYPSTTREVGSRSPANDVLTLITDRPIATVIDPGGDSPIAANGVDGFWQTLPLSTFPFEPVNRGQAKITFMGDLTASAVPGHLLEMDGMPFTIGQVDLSEDGTRTTFTLTSSFRTGLNVGLAPTVKISCRPVYPPNPRDFVGSGPLVGTEDYELVLFGELDPDGSELPGRTLAPTVEYSINPGTGQISLLDPFQDPMDSGQKLLLSFTRQKTLQPFLQNGVPIVPRYLADYLYNTIPSDDNGFLGGQLTATYSYRNPDSFYFRILPLQTFLGEAVQEAVDNITRRQPAGGAIITSTGGSENWEQGRVGLLSERRHLEDLDRASRVFLDFYNTGVLAFEQIDETISGGFIGDRDGKFRFFVGRGKQYPPPGYEDTITGVLNPRNVWSLVWSAESPNPDFPKHCFESDNVVEPATAEIVDGHLEGDFLDVSRLDSLVASQPLSILNDVDDRVLIDLDRPTKTTTSSAPWFKFEAPGVYQRMGSLHFFSRLFPRTTRAFFITYPGPGANGSDPGVYTAGRVIGGTSVSTRGKTIAKLSNPVLGDITEVVSAAVFKRYARARIWGYFPDGVPANAFGPGEPASATDPAIIATPLLLRDLPINPDTGYPDHTQFLSQGGTLADLETGDPELAVPGFVQGDQIAFGQPDGTFLKALDGTNKITVPFSGLETYTGVFVHEVLYGCVLTFQDGMASPGSLIGPDDILVGLTPTGGYPAWSVLEQGDTILTEAAVNYDTGAALTDPIEAADLARAARQSGSFRLGFDLEIRQDGSVIDQTLPSGDDPVVWGLKEILGQNPPEPLTPLEGVVQFVYTSQNPLRIPALDGLERDDTGDYAIPYLRTGNTELDRFGEASSGLAKVMTTTDGSGFYVYPDEVLGDDGLIVSPLTGPNDPAVLITTQDFLPLPSADLGVGDVQRYDLLLVEVDQAAGLPGIEGILSVGEVTDNQVEPPRFVTATSPSPKPGDPDDSNDTGSIVRYNIDNAITYIDGTYPPDPQSSPPPGIEVVEVTGATTSTTFVFTSIGAAPTWDDGLGAGPPPTGGFNDIWSPTGTPGKQYNKITIEIIRRPDVASTTGPGGPLPGGIDGTVVYTIDIQGSTVTGTVPPALGGGSSVGTLAAVANPVMFGASSGYGVGSYIEIVTTAQWFSFGATPGNEAAWFIPYTTGGGTQATIYGFDFKVSVDTYNLAGSQGQSNTAYISDDRLTFNEVIDFLHTQERGTTHPLSSLSMQTQLVVKEVTLGGGVASTINRDINGGLKFSFLARISGLGTWDARVLGTSPEKGTLKVMGFEGYSDTPITASGLIFSAVPSNAEFEGGVICQGTGVTESKDNTALPPTETEWYDDRVTEIVVSAGAVENVMPGDILVIDKSDDTTHIATTKAGTYLVHHSVEANSGTTHKVISPSAVAGGNVGWSAFKFPSVLSYDVATGTLYVTDTTGFTATGTLYVVLSIADIASSDLEVFQYSVLTVDYTTRTSSSFSGFTAITLADGTNITASVFSTLVSPGLLVSGRERFPVDLSPYVTTNLNSINTPGYEGALAIKGFRYLTVTAPTGTSPITFDSTAAEIEDAVPPTVSPIGVEEGVVGANETFGSGTDTRDRILYPNVVVEWGIDLTIGATTWEDLNIPAGSAGVGVSVIDCLLPGTALVLDDGAATPTPGFHAQAGIFLEPSFPRQVFDLATGGPHVVDEDHDLTTAEIGMRNFEDYLGITGVAPGTPEGVTFEVRRIRRFHDVDGVVGQNIMPLRFAYEIRRGRITSYTAKDTQIGVLVADSFDMDWEATKPGGPRAPDVWNDGVTYTGTNLGPFNDPDVNIQPGDLLRLLDEYGDVADEAEVLGVQDESTLLLAIPGLTVTPAVGQRFEVFLRKAPVPHEQSYEQLLDLITDTEVHRTFADEVAETGGYVPITEVNKLFDDLEAPGSGSDFGSLGVRRGDIVIVDPAGTMPNGETGIFPLGDNGIADRVAEYVVGGPSNLDDNRGWYRVVSVEPENGDPPHLVVSGTTIFTGESGNDVVFPEVATLLDEMGYAVYPTIHGSSLPAGADEGQMDLRPTEVAQAGTYDGDNYSIRPFSYWIIRPSSLFSDAAIDLVLSGRERILSWIQFLQGFLSESRGGDYFVFQRDIHAHDLGDPTDFTDGEGVLSNLFITSVLGNVDISPYLNSTSSLGFLDRRFWILDRRLDSLVPDPSLSIASKVYEPGSDPDFPDPGGPYTAYTDDSQPTPGSAVRPVLPDRIDTVLDNEDRFRPIRYTWLAYRTHRVLGTLAAIDRFDAELPERLAEQERLLDIENSSEGVS